MEARDRPPRIDVVGLGPAGPDLVTAGTLALIDEVEVRFVRTNRHPSAAVVGGKSFDHHYEELASFDDVYRTIASELVEAATIHGRVLYAVPGSPRVAEQTVDLLSQQDGVDVVVHAALSFLDLTWVALGVDPVEAGARIIDGHRFAFEAAGQTGPLLIAQCHSQQVLSDIKLTIDDPTGISVTVLQRLGDPDERVFELDWADLDREIEADHLTSIYVPRLPATVATEFGRFDELVKRLRQDCPWDAEQTHATLRRYLLEESYETLEALDHLTNTDDDSPALDQRYLDLQEELGDLLYQIFFHAILASEQGWFSVADVAQGIHDKLVGRHPHVFGGEDVSLDELAVRWEASKRQEKGRSSVMDGIPAALPALLYATKVQKKALAIGEAVPTGTAIDAEPADESQVGELLFAVVALARSLGIDAESALRQHAVAFADTIRATEAREQTDLI